MSEEQLKAFLEKVKADTSLQEKLKDAADADAALTIAKDAGFAITAEDIQSMQSSTDLSDDELEGVTGGNRNRIEELYNARLRHKLKKWLEDETNLS